MYPSCCHKQETIWIVPPYPWFQFLKFQFSRDQSWSEIFTWKILEVNNSNVSKLDAILSSVMKPHTSLLSPAQDVSHPLWRTSMLCMLSAISHLVTILAISITALLHKWLLSYIILLDIEKAPKRKSCDGSRSDTSKRSHKMLSFLLKRWKFSTY